MAKSIVSDFGGVAKGIIAVNEWKCDEFAGYAENARASEVRIGFAFARDQFQMVESS
jgi:hypothetical protein